MTRTITLAVTLLIATGCSNNLDGTWIGSWSGGLFSGSSGELTWELEQNGDDVTGTHEATGTDCLPSGNIDATFDADNDELSGAVTDGASTISFVAAYEDTSVSDGAVRLRGDFDVVESDCASGTATFNLEEE